jgi:hypothetical protein
MATLNERHLALELIRSAIIEGHNQLKVTSKCREIPLHLTTESKGLDG